MDNIQFTATFPNVAADKLPEFKQNISAALEKVRTETGVHQYDWFFNADETVCVVRETYADSDAILAHVANVGALIGPMAEMGGGLQLEVFGAVSDEVAEGLAGLAPTMYSHFEGL